MIGLPFLRHSFAAAFAAVVLVVLMAGGVIPTSVIVCGPPTRPPVMLAKANGAVIRSGAETDLVITVQESGALFIGSAAVPAAEFQARLADIVRRTPGRTLVLRPDRRSPFGATRAVVRGAQAVGFRTILIEGSP